MRAQTQTLPHLNDALVFTLWQLHGFFSSGLLLGQGVRTIVLNVTNKLHHNCEKLLPDMIMFDNFFKM